MTSRRSMKTPAEKMSRALQFIPGHVGGRVASAQPVLRRARVGVAGVVASAVLQQTGYASAFGGSSISPNFSAMTSGDLAVVVACCSGGTITKPASWTSVASGVVTGLRYEVAYLVSDGSDDVAFSYGAGGYAVLNGVVYRGAAGLTPSATVVETASNTVVNFPATSGIRPWQAIGYAPASPAFFSMTYAPDNGISTNYSNGISEYVTLHGMYPAKDDDLTNYPGPLAATWSLSSDVTGEWFTVALGLV
jgi:hypothetical protein